MINVSTLGLNVFIGGTQSRNKNPKRFSKQAISAHTPRQPGSYQGQDKEGGKLKKAVCLRKEVISNNTQYCFLMLLSTS